MIHPASDFLGDLRAEYDANTTMADENRAFLDEMRSELWAMHADIDEMFAVSDAIRFAHARDVTPLESPQIEAPKG